MLSDIRFIGVEEEELWCFDVVFGRWKLFIEKNYIETAELHISYYTDSISGKWTP
jgi:hypothetical protein